MLPITPMLLTNQNSPKKKIRKLNGIVIHWTANTGKGADAIANRNYFNTTKTAASAHYIVDDSKIIQCVPDTELAYHVGASKYTSTGEKIRGKPYSPNYFLIGIEMCVNSNGDWSKTYQNTVELAAYLLKKYGLTINDLYRHFDITGKNCPAMMIAESEWTKFKNAVNAVLIRKGQVLATALNIREQPSTQAKVLGQYKKGDVIEILEEKSDWYKTSKGWVCRDYVKIL